MRLGIYGMDWQSGHREDAASNHPMLSHKVKVEKKFSPMKRFKTRKKEINYSEQASKRDVESELSLSFVCLYCRAKILAPMMNWAWLRNLNHRTTVRQIILQFIEFQFFLFDGTLSFFFTALQFFLWAASASGRRRPPGRRRSWRPASWAGWRIGSSRRSASCRRRTRSAWCTSAGWRVPRLCGDLETFHFPRSDRKQG